MKKLYIAKSSIAGRGIFAGEDISKGEFIVQMNGKIIHKVYKTIGDLKIGRTWVPIKKHWWMSPEFPIKYTNHCCEPNTGFKSPRKLYAIKHIKKGVELSIDYATIEYVDFWSMPCTCGANKCRHKMHSIQFLPEATYKSYLPYIPRFLQKIYLNYKDGEKENLR